MTVFVHVPRTGGLALTEALRGSAVRAGGHRLAPAPGEAVVTILRDPVARFVSAYDHQRPDIGIEELAEDPTRGGWFFDPASRWLDGLDPVWVGHTETLHEDYDRLRAMLGLTADLPHVNATTRRSALSPSGVRSVRRHYADDLALLERLA